MKGKHFKSLKTFRGLIVPRVSRCVIGANSRFDSVMINSIFLTLKNINPEFSLTTGYSTDLYTKYISDNQVSDDKMSLQILNRLTLKNIKTTARSLAQTIPQHNFRILFKGRWKYCKFATGKHCYDQCLKLTFPDFSLTYKNKVFPTKSRFLDNSPYLSKMNY